MGEIINLFDWAEELVESIIASICEVISKEGGKDVTSIVEREYEKLPVEKQFILQYFVAECWSGLHDETYEELVKQNIEDVWSTLNYKP